MLIEFKGGPCDGERAEMFGDLEAAVFLVASHHPDKPVYRCSICPCCVTQAESEEIVDYLFVGYERRMRRTASTDSSFAREHLQEAAE